jgi:hypothetical protein
MWNKHGTDILDVQYWTKTRVPKGASEDFLVTNIPSVPALMAIQKIIEQDMTLERNILGIILPIEVYVIRPVRMEAYLWKVTKPEAFDRNPVVRASTEKMLEP